MTDNQPRLPVLLRRFPSLLLLPPAIPALLLQHPPDRHPRARPFLPPHPSIRAPDQEIPTPPARPDLSGVASLHRLPGRRVFFDLR
jgi:hypothetical protein